MQNPVQARYKRLVAPHGVREERAYPLHLRRVNAQPLVQAGEFRFGLLKLPAQRRRIAAVLDSRNQRGNLLLQLGGAFLDVSRLPLHSRLPEQAGGFLLEQVNGLRLEQVRFQGFQKARFHQFPAYPNIVSAYAFAPVPVIGASVARLVNDDEIPAAFSALEQAGEKILRPRARAGVLVKPRPNGAGGVMGLLLARFHTRPKRVINDPKLRALDDDPFLPILEAFDPAPRLGFLDDVCPVPCQFADINPVCKDAAPLEQVAVYGREAPLPAARRGNPFLVQDYRNRLGRMAVGVHRENAPNNGGLLFVYPPLHTLDGGAAILVFPAGVFNRDIVIAEYSPSSGKAVKNILLKASPCALAYLAPVFLIHHAAQGRIVLVAFAPRIHTVVNTDDVDAQKLEIAEALRLLHRIAP